MTVSSTIKISMSSECSEADLHQHLSEFVGAVKGMRYDGWRTTVQTGWDTQYPVEIEIEEVKT